MEIFKKIDLHTAVAGALIYGVAEYVMGDNPVRKLLPARPKG